ncbi:hypothetical protein SB773_34845, partial [Bacillus sp. SIMBA_074]|uniref:hypothetical protein n=1 Tax=Bacillus sp. SIMBA_074 TaxID=3085812 RepID=UPI003978A679
AIGKIIDNWDVFRKKVSEYNYSTANSSLNESYKELAAAYLENRTHDQYGSIRLHFQDYAKSLGIRTSDILLPSDTP